LHIVTIHVNQECATCGPQKGPDFKRLLPIFCGWPTSCLTCRAWNIQLWPVDQSGYVRLAVLHGCTPLM